MAYRPEFLAALRLFAEASAEVVEQGWAPPIIVGGAAVEWYTGGAIMSGDIDAVTGAQASLEAALLKRGFRRVPGGLINAELGLAFEVVSGHLLDGRADRARVQMADLSGEHASIIGIEDLIADRMGQYCAGPRPDVRMLEQARDLYSVALEINVDADYLERRIREETAGLYGLTEIQTPLPDHEEFGPDDPVCDT